MPLTLGPRWREVLSTPECTHFSHLLKFLIVRRKTLRGRGHGKKDNKNSQLPITYVPGTHLQPNSHYIIVISRFPFYRWGKWGLENLSYLLKVTYMIRVWRTIPDFCEQAWVDLVWSWKCHKTWSILLWTEIEQPKCSQPFLRNFIAIPSSLQIWAQALGAKDKHVPGKVPVGTGSSSYKSPLGTY